jgi:hypothetical protein
MAIQNHPSTDATMTMLVGNGRMPIVEASANLIQGSESMFARVEVDTMRPGQPERHACHFVLIGSRASVLAVLDELRAAVDDAQPARPDLVTHAPTAAFFTSTALGCPTAPGVAEPPGPAFGKQRQHPRALGVRPGVLAFGVTNHYASGSLCGSWAAWRATAVGSAAAFISQGGWSL